MLPSILAKQLQKGIGDYIQTTFPMTNEPFKGSVQNLLATKDSVYHEPYVSIRLPFRVAEVMPSCFEAIHPAYLPYVHQQTAFDRLAGDDGRSTLIATGTGSGKTECFLYPILEYCYLALWFPKRVTTLCSKWRSRTEPCGFHAWLHQILA